MASSLTRPTLAISELLPQIPRSSVDRLDDGAGSSTSGLRLRVWADSRTQQEESDDPSAPRFGRRMRSCARGSRCIRHVGACSHEHAYATDDAHGQHDLELVGHRRDRCRRHRHLRPERDGRLDAVGVGWCYVRPEPGSSGPVARPVRLLLTNRSRTHVDQLDVAQPARRLERARPVRPRQPNVHRVRAVRCAGGWPDRVVPPRQRPRRRCSTRARSSRCRAQART